MAKIKKTAVEEVELVQDEDITVNTEIETIDGEPVESADFDAVIESVPAVEEKQHLVRVHVLKDISNIYILGNRYTFREGETVAVPTDVAYILKSDNSVI